MSSVIQTKRENIYRCPWVCGSRGEEPEDEDRPYVNLSCRVCRTRISSLYLLAQPRTAEGKALQNGKLNDCDDGARRGETRAHLSRYLALRRYLVEQTSSECASYVRTCSHWSHPQTNFGT